LDCPEIRSSFVGGRVPEGPAVDEHLKGCPHCPELFASDARLGRRLAQAVLPAVEPGDLFAKLNQDLSQDVGLRARLRALPTRVRGAALVTLGLLLLASQLVMGRRSDFEAYSPGVFWGVVAVLGAMLGFGSLRLMRGASAPLRAAAGDRSFTALLLVLPALVALIAPLGSPFAPASAGASWETTWGSPGGCFSYGAAAVVPFLALAWLFERRERMPFTVLVSTGALAGVAANLVLHAHCASAHLGHLLLGHASVGAAWALGLALLSRGFNSRQSSVVTRQ
jgi:hypothetical protein